MICKLWVKSRTGRERVKRALDRCEGVNKSGHADIGFLGGASSLRFDSLLRGLREILGFGGKCTSLQGEASAANHSATLQHPDHGLMFQFVNPGLKAYWIFKILLDTQFSFLGWASG